MQKLKLQFTVADPTLASKWPESAKNNFANSIPTTWELQSSRNFRNLIYGSSPSTKSLHSSGETRDFYRDISSRFNPSIDKVRELLLIPITKHNRIIKSQDCKNLIQNADPSFPCQKCDLRFTQCSSLKRHEKTIHDNRKDYECGVCKKKFGEPGNLQKHTKTVHEKRYAIFDQLFHKFRKQHPIHSRIFIKNRRIILVVLKVAKRNSDKPQV